MLGYIITYNKKVGMLHISFAALNLNKTETVKLSDGSDFTRYCFITLPEEWKFFSLPTVQSYTMFSYFALFDNKFSEKVMPNNISCGSYHISELQKIVFKAKNLIDLKYKNAFLKKESIFLIIEKFEQFIIVARNAGADTISWNLV